MEPVDPEDLLPDRRKISRRASLGLVFGLSTLLWLVIALVIWAA